LTTGHAQNGEGRNKLSAAAIRALDTLLLKNPERTAIGMILGLSIQGAYEVFAPIIARSGIGLGPFDWWASVSLGVVLVHLPFIVWSVRHKPLISDELESLIQLIESTNIGEIEKRSAYRKVVNKCIDQFSLSAKPGTIREIVTTEAEGIQKQPE
jgi:hypothetical protein